MTLEDRLAIGELLALLYHSLDSGDARGFSECFTERGVIDGRRGRIEGRAALERYANEATARCVGYGVDPRHIVTNLVIQEDREDAGRAAAKSYGLYYEVDAEAILFHTAAIQYDDLVKLDGEWKIDFRKYVWGPGGLISNSAG